MTDERILQQGESDQVDDPWFDKLQGEMYVARRSQVGDEVRKHYYGLFDQVQTQSIIADWVETLQALLNLDTRQKLPEGVRSGSVAMNYRLHYKAEQAEIELSVETQGQYRKIEGDLFGNEELGAALIQIQAQDSYEIAHETTSNESGRFRLENVNSGNCLMVVTPETGPAIEVALELT